MGISVSMNCPNCGGTLSLEEGSRTTTCPYCTMLLEVQGDEGVSKIMLTNKTDRDKAIAAVKGWWKSGFKARDLTAKGEVTECYPIYVPFWKLKARVAGWVCGYNVRQTKNSTEKVPKETMVSRYIDWNQVACDPGDIGIEHMSGLEGDAVLHDEGSIPTFEATTSYTDAKAKGLESVRSEAINSAGVSHQTFVKIHVFLKNMALVLYPVWMVRYKYSDRMYFATVDGVNGKVLSGRAPGDFMWRSLIMTGGMALGGFGSMFGLWIAGYIGGNGSVIGLIIAAICLGAAYFSYQFYRYGAEVTTGDVKGDMKKMPSADELGKLAGMAGQGNIGGILMEEIGRNR